eukprot:symbB.v1.2.009364.t1/scaffold592.1/size209785/5
MSSSTNESQATQNWNLIYGVFEKFQLEVSASEKKRASTLIEDKHGLLCSWLKTLYVGITRARKRVWILESQDSGQALVGFLKGLGVAQVCKVGDAQAVQGFADTSSAQEWFDQGLRMFRDIGNFDQAWSLMLTKPNLILSEPSFASAMPKHPASHRVPLGGCCQKQRNTKSQERRTTVRRNNGLYCLQWSAAKGNFGNFTVNWENVMLETCKTHWPKWRPKEPLTHLQSQKLGLQDHADIAKCACPMPLLCRGPFLALVLRVLAYQVKICLPCRPVYAWKSSVVVENKR